MTPYRQIIDPKTREVSNDMILRVEDEAFIPADERNRDWREYQAWLAEGNTPDAPTTETP